MVDHWTACNDCGQKIISSHKLSSGVCSICGAVPEDMVCKHENAAWEEVTAPECKKPGLKQQVCSECGEVIDEEEIPGLKHKFAKSVTKAGNCVEGSEFLFTCNLCGESYTEKKEPAGHIFENEVCTVCGEKWSFGDEAVYTFAEGVSIPETAKLTVTDCTDEYMADEVPEAIKHAEKVIRVALVDNESETALPGKVEIQLPCTEEILAKLENTMLMFLAENGELLEIQYRIENGMIIFSIEANGIYAFVPVES